MLKELWLLIKLFFKKIEKGRKSLPILKMYHFPLGGYSAMMWCCHLIDNAKDNYTITQKTMNHEMVHYQQACHIGSNFGYYITYLWEWLKLGLFAQSIYYCHPMEIEAYIYEVDPNYVSHKGKWKEYRIKNIRRLYLMNKKNWKTFIRSYDFSYDNPLLK